MMASLSNTSLTTLCEPQDPGARLSTSSLNDVRLRREMELEEKAETERGKGTAVRKILSELFQFVLYPGWTEDDVKVEDVSTGRRLGLTSR